MNTVDKLQNKTIIFNNKIDKFFMELGYELGSPIYIKSPRAMGLKKWFFGELFDTHVCICKDNIYFYKEYKGGNEINRAKVKIDSSDYESLIVFMKRITEIFEEMSYLFP